MININVTQEEYDLIMDLRRPRKIYKNEYVIHENYAEIVIRDKFYNEVCRAKIDIEDIENVKDIRWYLGSQGYIMGHIGNKKNITLHKIITKTGSRELVDHINCNKLDNRKCNLRNATYQENVFNKKCPKNNKSGHRGIRVMPSGRFSAYITINKKQISLGTYDTFEEAKKTRLEAEQKYFGKYAYKGI